jgi:hypothetical protein
MMEDRLGSQEYTANRGDILDEELSDGLAFSGLGGFELWYPFYQQQLKVGVVAYFFLLFRIGVTGTACSILQGFDSVVISLSRIDNIFEWSVDRGLQNQETGKAHRDGKIEP